MRVVPNITSLAQHLSQSDKLPKIASIHPQSVRAKDFLVANWVDTLPDFIQELQSIKQTDVPNWLFLANAYRHIDDHLAKDLAQSIYEHLMDHWEVSHISCAWAAIGLSKIFGRATEVQKSLDYAAFATVLDPNNGHAWHRLGDCLREDVKKRWEAYERALNLAYFRNDRKLMSKAYVGMGSMWEAHAEFQTAFFYFDMALYHDPTSDAAARAVTRLQRHPWRSQVRD